jgi:4'-phosphopantetheinyl transferase
MDCIADHRDSAAASLSARRDRCFDPVQLWLLPVARSWSCLESCMWWLDSSELKRVEDLMFHRDRLLFASSHLWLRRVLSEYLWLDPSSVRFLRSPNGKPRVDTSGTTHPGLSFSLSHTQGAILVGVSFHGEIGVDIEQVRAIEDLRGLCGAVLHPDEECLLRPRAAAPQDRDTPFFRIWTAKEAYAKARGVGLALPFRQLSVQLEEAGRFRVDDHSDGPDRTLSTGGWSASFGPDGEGRRYTAAACKLQGAPRFVLRTIEAGVCPQDTIPDRSAKAA